MLVNSFGVTGSRITTFIVAREVFFSSEANDAASREGRGGGGGDDDRRTFVLSLVKDGGFLPEVATSTN